MVKKLQDVILKVRLNKPIKKQNKIKPAEQLLILKALDQFFKSGYSLIEAIVMLSFRYSIDHWLPLLQEGESLGSILTVDHYDSDVLLIINVFENSSQLAEGIVKSIEILQYKIENKDQIWQTMKYPILLFGILFGSMFFISIVLLPQFELIFSSFNLKKTMTITIIFGILRYAPLFILICSVIGLLLVSNYLRKSQEQKIAYILKNKYLKKVYLNIYNKVFTINITNLLKIGLRLDEIFKILSNQSFNILLKSESMRILQELNNGYSLSQTIKVDYYTTELQKIIEDGEKTGMLVHNLNGYSLLLTESQKTKNQKLIFLIQPIFYGMFGGLIILLYSAIFLPMFQMMDNL